MVASNDPVSLPRLGGTKSDGRTTLRIFLRLIYNLYLRRAPHLRELGLARLSWRSISANSHL